MLVYAADIGQLNYFFAAKHFESNQGFDFIFVGARAI